MTKHTSFESAGSYPYKLLFHAEKFIREGFSPTHIFIYPTNACNLNCEYCCCGDEDRRAEPMSVATFKEILDLTLPKAITVAGGGEPTIHTHIEELLAMCLDRGIKTGLMTNGIALNKIDDELLESLAWVRISMDKNRTSIPRINHKRLSYIWVGEANNLLLTLHQWEHRGEIKNLRLMGDIHKSTLFERGTKRCYMPLVRPVFAPDGGVYACCRAHYAIKGSKRLLPDELRVADNVADYMADRRTFDGSICDRCFYAPFNRLMDRIQYARGTEDVEFI